MSNDWMQIYDAVFFISIAGIIVGLLSLIIKTCLRSKCEHFSLCWGLLAVDRRVDLEVEEEMHRIDVTGTDDIEAPQPPPTQPTKSVKRPSITPSEHGAMNLV